MADNHTKEVRSRNMSHIRSTNTKPEEKVRKYLFSKGFRYRKNVRKLPGCPDIVLPKYHTVIFVNGCFWHKHDCHLFRLPKSHKKFWKTKLDRNFNNDVKNTKQALKDGWRVIIIWECAIKGKSKLSVDKIELKLIKFILSEDKKLTIRGKGLKNSI